METGQDNHFASDNINPDSIAPDPVTTPDMTKYTLDIPAIAVRFQAAGFDISERTASRRCETNRLDCVLVPMQGGRIEKYFATSESVDAEIAKMRRFHNPDTSRFDSIFLCSYLHRK